jgi:hypothetical protein
MAIPSTVLSPYAFPLYWGRMTIGGVYVPGIILSFDGANKPERWIIQMGLTVSNSVTIWRGTGLAESIEIVSRITDEVSYQAACRYRDTLRPKLGRKPPSLIAVNGVLNWCGITRVSTRNIFILPASGCSWDVHTILVEFNPMKMAPVGPADPPKKETENDRLAAQLARLAKEATKL